MNINHFTIALIISLLSVNLIGQDISEIYSLLNSGEFKKAIEKTEMLGDEFKCDKYEILGYSYKNINNYINAVTYYEEFNIHCTPNYKHRINLGDIYYKIGQKEKARQQFLIAKEEMPGLALLDFNLGLIEYDIGNKYKAVEYLTSAINNTKGEVLDFDYVEMQIKVLNELKEYDLAFTNINEILDFWDSESIEYKYTLIIRSSIFGAKREYKTAIKELEEVISSGIDNEVVLLEAYIYQLEFYSKLNQKKEACRIYERIENINPEIQILNEYDCQ